VAARRGEDRPRLAPADSGAQHGHPARADLAAFRAGQISREEVISA
jgi:hypothetical protein